MVRMRTAELMVGVFMLIGILALFFLALQVSNLSTVANVEGYKVTARFDNIGSLKVKAPVSMAGVKVGRVSEISFDGASYEAVVTMTIGTQYDTIPDDTFAKIYTAGLLGEQYIGLEAGGSEIYLEDGGEIEMTQSSLVLEEVIGQFLFSKAAEGGKESKADSTSESSADANSDKLELSFDKEGEAGIADDAGDSVAIEGEAATEGGDIAEGGNSDKTTGEVAGDLQELVKPETAPKAAGAAKQKPKKKTEK